jgi:4-hydroxybenzoate polyprenyltransferase
MKLFTYLFKLSVYSNLFVSICVTAFTHLTYLLYNLPTDNITPVLVLVFCFTYFTYNGQRIIRLKKNKLYIGHLGERLIWVNNNIPFLLVSTFIAGGIGLTCVFYLHPNCLYLLIPMGIISVLYVTPKLKTSSFNLSLRQIPYIKILLIAIVWGATIILLPFIETQMVMKKQIDFKLAFLQVIHFIIAITLPFDIRDLKYDKVSKLKTLPQIFGVKKTVILSELLLLSSAILLFMLVENKIHLWSLMLGHLFTMIIIAFSNENRKELFFAGLVESTVLIVWGCVITADYLFSL